METTKTIRRDDKNSTWYREADLCVVGAGIAGISAAITAASIGKKVILVDANSFLGGQTYNSNIGCFGGFYDNGGANGKLLTPLVAEEMFEDLKKENGITECVNDTIVLAYDANLFLRWVEKKLQSLGVTVLLGAIVDQVTFTDRRIQEIALATRYGRVNIRAAGYVDASGDATLGWNAGLLCRTAKDTKVWGSQMIVLKGVNYSVKPPAPEEINARASEKASLYGLKRTSNVVFYLPNRDDLFYGNMTHVDTPMDPFEDSLISITGKDEVDTVVAFLKGEFPETFANAQIHHYVNTGIRQSRSISAVHQLTTQELCSGEPFADSVGRTAWPIELHSSEESYTWDVFDNKHVHYIPLSCMISPEADNYAAAGRCIDADVTALASVRVMGPCCATGTAAAYALALAGEGSVHDINMEDLHSYIRRNLED